MLRYIRVFAEYKLGALTHNVGPYRYCIKTRAKTAKGLNNTALRAARKIFPNATRIEVYHE